MSVPGPKPEFQNPGQRSVSQNISFSQLLNDVDQAKVRDVVIQGQEIHGTWTDSRGFNTYDSISVSFPLVFELCWLC